MPKYNPTEDDLYSVKLCPICGREVIFDDQVTCSSLCEQQWKMFKEDFEESLFNFEWEDNDRRL